MKYRFTLQKRHGSWVYVLCFGKDTPTEIKDVEVYSDRCVSAADAHGVRHFVYSKGGYLVAIALHDALRLLPSIDHERPETLRMPSIHAIQFGTPAVPTLLLRFREQPPDDNTAYAIAPDVYLIFQGPELALHYVCDVYKNIAEVA
jgi:hypothetical protein